MRLSSTFLLASFLLGTAACAANGTSSGGSPGEGGKQQPGSNTPGTNEENKPPPEKPLTAREVCETIETDSNFGRGCSGSGSGQEVCAFDDTYCGANKCVYDSRKGDTFSFTCAPRCNAADTSVSCPLGYECVAPTLSCAGNAEDGVCTKRVDNGCEKTSDTSGTGTLLEGPDGALLSIRWSGSQGSVRQKTTTGWKTLTSWSDTTSSGYGYVYGVARTATSVLILTSTYEILVEGGAAKATKRPTSTTSYTPTIGVGKDGNFISLEQASGSYATVSKRGADGKWTEVGPTRKRVASVNVLGEGFIARCGEDLCTSVDGENFDTLTLPNDVSFTETTRFVAAGTSSEDFYFAVEGRLFHQRKGKWVEEGPRGVPSSTSSSYNDTLKVSSTGTVAFFTWNGSKYTTYTTTTGGECWKTTTADNLNSAALVGDAFKWSTYSSSGDLCSLTVD